VRCWLLALLVLLIPAAQADELPKIHLKVVGGLGQTVQFKNYEEPFWTRQLAERSGGRLTAEVSPYDQDGLSGPELLQLARLGAITIGNVPLAQIVSEDPEVAGLDLPGLNGDIAALRRSVEAYRSTLADIYRDRYNLELLAVWTNPAQVIFCTRPISGLADLRGLKIRVASAIHADFIAGLGGTGITTPYKEVKAILQQHVTDCAVTAAISGYRSGLQEVASYIHGATISWGPNILIANRDAWTRLGPDVQTFLRQQIDELSAQIWRSVDQESVEGIYCLTGNGPCPSGPTAHLTYVPEGASDRDLRRRALVETVLPRWIDRCGESCAIRWDETIGRLWGLQASVSEP